MNEQGAQGIKARPPDRLAPERLASFAHCDQTKASLPALRAMLFRSPLLLFACRTALHRALGGGHAECARFLIENGADPNKADTLKRTPLHWAAMGPAPGNVECCEIIFE